MLIPCISFDPQSVAEEMLQASKEPSSRRDKCLFATVRGMGGGKTRAFEEIRRALLRKKGVLAMKGWFFNNPVWGFSMK